MSTVRNPSHWSRLLQTFALVLFLSSTCWSLDSDLTQSLQQQFPVIEIYLISAELSLQKQEFSVAETKLVEIETRLSKLNTKLSQLPATDQKKLNAQITSYQNKLDQLYSDLVVGKTLSSPAIKYKLSVGLELSERSGNSTGSAATYYGDLAMMIPWGMGLLTVSDRSDVFNDSSSQPARHQLRIGYDDHSNPQAQSSYYATLTPLTDGVTANNSSWDLTGGFRLAHRLSNQSEIIFQNDLDASQISNDPSQDRLSNQFSMQLLRAFGWKQFDLKAEAEHAQDREGYGLLATFRQTVDPLTSLTLQNHFYTKSIYSDSAQNFFKEKLNLSYVHRPNSRQTWTHHGGLTFDQRPNSTSQSETILDLRTAFADFNGNHFTYGFKAETYWKMTSTDGYIRYLMGGESHWQLNETHRFSLAPDVTLANYQETTLSYWDLNLHESWEHRMTTSQRLIWSNILTHHTLRFNEPASYTRWISDLSWFLVWDANLSIRLQGKTELFAPRRSTATQSHSAAWQVNGRCAWIIGDDGRLEWFVRYRSQTAEDNPAQNLNDLSSGLHYETNF